MKKRVLAIVSVIVGAVSPAFSQQTQPIQWFGYAGIGSAADVNAVSGYTNFIDVVAQPNTLLQPANNSMVVSVESLFWSAPPTGSTIQPFNGNASNPSVQESIWQAWLNVTGVVNNQTTSNAMLVNTGTTIAITVATEYTARGYQPADIEAVAFTMKQHGFKTMILDRATSIAAGGSNYVLPLNNVDWVGTWEYGAHPYTDPTFQTANSILNTRIQGSSRKKVYVLDGFWDPNWQGASVAKTPADMDAIAQEWFTVASSDPNAILLGVFAWDSPGSPPVIGSSGFRSNVLAEHQAIGASIIAHKSPNYQGYLDVASCGQVAGWAWDANQPNNPISVSISVDSLAPVTVRANSFRQDLLNAGIGNGYHAFWYTPPASIRDGQQHLINVTYCGTGSSLTASPRYTETCVCSSCSVSIAWVKPSSVTWGPANTLTVAGYAQNGVGGVKMYWRDATTGGGWNAVGWAPTPAADGTWSNTIPSSNYCHDYQVYAVYAGLQSAIFTYHGLTSGYCSETASITWIQPQPSAGYGPPGSLIVAGSASGAPAGTGVVMSYRDVTAGSGWVTVSYAPSPDSNGIWLNSISNANYYHQYQVKVVYDALVTVCPCTYQGTNSITWCGGC
jgi:hypothetical protein